MTILVAMVALTASPSPPIPTHRVSPIPTHSVSPIPTHSVSPIPTHSVVPIPAHGVSPIATILVAVVALAVGAAAGAIAASRGARRIPQPPARVVAPQPPARVVAPQPPARVVAPPRADTAALASAQAERAQLVKSCADLADRLRDHQPGLFTVLSRDLQAVGVTMQLPDGEFFSTDRHNPVGIEKTTNPSEDLRVAATTRLGYLDHGVTVRVPDVIIYRCDGVNHAT
jgi:hypothetical protein